MSAAEHGPLTLLEAVRTLYTVRRGWLASGFGGAACWCMNGRVIARISEPLGTPEGVEAVRRVVARVPALLAAAGPKVRASLGCDRSSDVLGNFAEEAWAVGSVERSCSGNVSVTFPPITPELSQDCDGIQRLLTAVPALAEAVAGRETTPWQLGMGGWWRRECGMTLRVFTRSLPPRDEEAQWLCDVDPVRLTLDAPGLHEGRVVRPAAEARAWCDRWVEWLLREVAR